MGVGEEMEAEKIFSLLVMETNQTKRQRRSIRSSIMT